MGSEPPTSPRRPARHGERRPRAPALRVCSACGNANAPEAWLCGCGQDLREQSATLGPGQGSERSRPARTVRRLLGPPVGFALAFGGCGVYRALSSEAGFFGRDFDLKVYGICGAALGVLVGLVVSAVRLIQMRRRAGGSPH